jgi:23S rRNA pseudouridine1911/1915/1917 synthase
VLGRAPNSLGALEYKKPGNVFLGLLHRLDRPVSGIILFAKTSKGASRLSEQFRDHKVEKIYHTVVVGKPLRDRGVLVNYLIKDEKLKKSRKSEKGEESNLYYEVIKFNAKYSLLKITIDTGKFHQISAQLSLAGFPILGDVKYLPVGRQVVTQWNNKKSIALCATNISFETATTKEIITLSIETPKEWESYIK